MHIEELKEGGVGSGEVAEFGAKRALVGAGARFLFYPTLLYNVVRNRFQPEFRWWDEVDEFLLLGAVPFPTDVPRLRELGVRGVVTLNEPYETLVSTSLYSAHDIKHMLIPTRDYFFAPSFADICQAVNFIHENASCRGTTYVHCKAGRGRSTTIVLCYLVQHKLMAPKAAFQYVRRRRPRVLLASSQWQAVQMFYRLRVQKLGMSCCLDIPAPRPHAALVTTAPKLSAFDDTSVVVVTEADLDGYDDTSKSGVIGNKDIWTEHRVVNRAQLAGQAALARLSCLWVRCHAPNKMPQPGKLLTRDKSCSVEADQLGNLGVDIRVC